MAPQQHHQILNSSRNFIPVMMLVVPVLLLVLVPDPSMSLTCYKCDVKHNLSCPGWTRDPVDTVVDLGDTKGLYTHCVTVTLRDGTIVEQNPYPGETHCQQKFVESWQYLLNQEYNQEVIVSCCDENNCNGNPEPIKKNKSPEIAASSLALCGLSFIIVVIFRLQ